MLCPPLSFAVPAACSLKPVACLSNPARPAPIRWFSLLNLPLRPATMAA